MLIFIIFTVVIIIILYLQAHPEEMAEAKQRLGKLKNIASQKMSDNGLRF